MLSEIAVVVWLVGGAISGVVANRALTRGRYQKPITWGQLILCMVCGGVGGPVALLLAVIGSMMWAGEILYERAAPRFRDSWLNHPVFSKESSDD